LIGDLLPRVAALVFDGALDVSLSALQLALLVGMGLQRKDVEDVAAEVRMPVQQVLAMLNKAVRKLAAALGNEARADDGEAVEDDEALAERLADIKEGHVLSLPRTAAAAAAAADGSEAVADDKDDGEAARQKRREQQGRKFAGRDKRHKRG